MLIWFFSLEVIILCYELLSRPLQFLDHNPADETTGSFEFICISFRKQKERQFSGKQYFFLIAFNKHTNTSFHKRGESESQSWVLVNEQSSSELTLLQTRLTVQLFSEGAPRHSIKYKYYTDCLQLFSQIKRIQHDAVVISGFSLILPRNDCSKSITM